MYATQNHSAAQPARAFAHFDVVHWQQVKLERARQGLPCWAPQQQDHPLEGARLRERSSGEVYRVRRVLRDWRCGWYLQAWLEREATPRVARVVVVENRSSVDNGVLEQLQEFADDFEQVPPLGPAL